MPLLSAGLPTEKKDTREIAVPTLKISKFLFCPFNVDNIEMKKLDRLKRGPGEGRARARQGRASAKV